MFATKARIAELTIMAIASTLLTLAVVAFNTPAASQPSYPPRPSTPPCSWVWTQLPSGHVNWAWGYLDGQGFFHAAPQPNSPEDETGGLVGALDPRTGATNYGVDMGAIREDGKGATIRASSAQAEAMARDIASKIEPELPDVDRFRKDPFGLGAEARRLLVYGFAGVALIAAAFVAWGKR